MARDEQEKFLSRWSRLKKDVRQTEVIASEQKVLLAPPVAPPADPPKQSPAAPATAEPQLPPIDTLKGLASEYTEFLKPGVDESLRRSALICSENIRRAMARATAALMAGRSNGLVR